MAYLEINDLQKSFGNEQVLKGVSLSIEKGQVLSIIGSSGSGKTTLLRCINFLETPDGGTMTLDGKVLISGETEKKPSEAELREKRLNFGLVFQSFNLFPQYTVKDNVTLAPKLLLKDEFTLFKKTCKDKAERKKFLADGYEKIDRKCNALLERIGLADKAGAYPFELSGGQSQRVAIARALALDPKILCFDEPTSALDPELTGEVLKVIRSLKDDGKTMIIVTHEMGFAKNVSDKAVFMSEGVIAEEGDPEKLFDNPQTEKLKNFLQSVKDKDGE